MPSLDTIALFVAATVVLHASPGPSNLYVMACSLRDGHLAGVAAAASLAAGSPIYALATALGLSAVLLHLPEVFLAVKIAGAVYLVVLGLRALAAPGGLSLALSGRGRAAGRARCWRAFRQSILVELLNPKTGLFYVALLPQFVDRDAGSAIAQMLVLGVLVVLTAVPFDLAVAFGSGRIAAALSRRAWLERLQRWTAGLVLIGIGASLALSER